MKNTNQTTRERVIEEAAEQFYLKGYKSTTMRSLAAAVGIKHPSLFSIFENKSAIAAVILQEYYTGVQKSAEKFAQEHFGENAGEDEMLLVFCAMNFLLVSEDRRFAEFYISFYDEDSEKVDEVTEDLNHLAEDNEMELNDPDAQMTYRLDFKTLGMISMMLIKELNKKNITPEFAVQYFIGKILRARRKVWAVTKEDINRFYAKWWDEIRAEALQIDIYRDYFMM